MEIDVDNIDSEKTGCYSYTITGILSASEVTLGSYLHFLHIPFTGKLMSLNQCFWLNVSKNWSPDNSAMTISFQVAAFKLMSPLGKRMTPMIAISIQGMLFEAGCRCFGSNIIGRLAGSILMSFWPLLQASLIYLLLLGNSLFQIADFYSMKLGINVYAGVGLIVLFEICIAAFVSILSGVLSRSLIEQYGSWIQKLEEKLKPKKTLKNRLQRLLFSPVAFSLALIIVYLYFTTDSTEDFVRESLFYSCWIVAMSYILDLVKDATFKHVFVRKEDQRN